MHTKMDLKEISSLLRRLADAVDHCDPKDFESLLSGQSNIELVSRRVRSISQESKRSFGLSVGRQKDYLTLASRLRELPTRAEGWDLLVEAKLTRKDLEALARSMDLPVARDDDTERLRNRILETTIGARLNSQAIRGE